MNQYYDSSPASIISCKFEERIEIGFHRFKNNHKVWKKKRRRIKECIRPRFILFQRKSNKMFMCSCYLKEK